MTVLGLRFALTAKLTGTHTANPRVSRLLLFQHYYNDLDPILSTETGCFTSLLLYL